MIERSHDGDTSAWAKVAKLATGRPGRLKSYVYRWADEIPSDSTEIGSWLPDGDPRIPDWLRKYGEIVAVLENDVVVAAVGRKRHDQWAHEMTSGTDPAFRGRGFARSLHIQMGRRILREGAVCIGIHDELNIASARMAEGAGLLDHGWRWFEWETPPSRMSRALNKIRRH